MKKTLLNDGTSINCISRFEAQMLDKHIDGYLDFGIKVNEGDTIIDIGANIGILGTKMSNKFNDIAIHSFEPISFIYEVLEKNSIDSKNEMFKTYPFGISDKNETIEFMYYPNIPALSTSNPELWKTNSEIVKALKGSLKNSPDKWWWSNLIPEFLYPFIVLRLKKNPKKVKCNLKTLAYVIDYYSITKINLLKIDCEGNELKVINGIKKENWDLIDQVVVEVHNIEGRLDYMSNILKNIGFEIKIVKEPSLKETNLFNIFAVK